jgi:histidine ammonia-lyase
VDNLNHILGVELLCAAQGIEFRAPLKTSAPLSRVVSRLRQDVLKLGEDRYLAPDLERAALLIASGEITRAAATRLPGLET